MSRWISWFKAAVPRSKGLCHCKRPPIKRRLGIEQLERRELLSASWTALTQSRPIGIGTMNLLSDGSVIMTDGGSSWARLVPTSSGSYVSGTWTRLANAAYTRLYDATQLLQNGQLFVAGGEYGTGASTGEIYNPLTNAWTELPSQSFGAFIDSNSMVLPNGNVLIAPVAPSSSGHTTIFNTSTDTWSQGPKLYRGSSADEQSWVELPDGSILTVDGSSTSERYIPSLNQWVNDGTVPDDLFDSLGEIGPAVLLPDGQAIFFGATSNTAIYTPSGTSSPGTWVAGPTIPNGNGCDDAPAAVLRDGTVLLAAGPSGTYNGPTTFYTYNPTGNTFSAVTGAPSIGGAPYGSRMLALPNGDVLFASGSTIYDYNPDTTPLAAATPAITSITPNSDGSMLLTGTLLNGIDAGATYGDDAQMNTNFPIVQLVQGSSVYYARTYNWSSTGVATGSTPETTDFTLPLGIPAGTYSVYLVANGISSLASSLTVPTTIGDSAPTVATPAAAMPTTVTGTSVNLSVLGADTAGESTLTYTWNTATSSNSVQLPSFSANGTNAAKTTTATFHQYGSYTFTVTITDSGGQSTTSSVVVNVTQTQTSVALTPSLASLGGGSTQQFTATANDQFGNKMATQPSFTWSVASGTGSVSSSGLYTSLSSGTLATVSVSGGGDTATAQVGVVTAPWSSADIGGPGITGTAYDNGTTFTVEGSGSDIWGTSDEFHYVYRPLTGNGVIIARVATLTNTNAWAKVGVMIRNSLANNDAYALECVTPGNGTSFQYRTTSGGSAADGKDTTGPAAPYWVKLVRNGNIFTGYRSADGVTWTEDSSTTITMGSTVYIGLETDSHDNSLLDTATIDHVSLFAAVNDSLNVNPGIAGSVNVLANDSVPSGGTLTVTSFTQGSKGSVVNSGNGVLKYTPNAGAKGADSFTYTVSDGLGDTATATVRVLINGLQAYYEFDEDTGTTTADATNSGLNGTIQSATWTSGVEGTNGLAFNGTSSYVSLPAMNLATNTATISAWIKTGGSQSSFTGLVFCRGGTTVAGLHFGTANELRYTWNNNPSTYNWNSGLVVPTNQWTFVALVVNATGATIYMQPQGGSMQSATNNVANVAQAFDAVTDIGQDPNGGRFFNGSMDEVRIYNTALNSAGITGLANLAPTVVNAAAASPATVSGTSTALSALGSAIGGEANLTYTWAATLLPNGAAQPSFSPNGTNASKNTTATFSTAGNYTLTVTMTDLAGQTIKSSVNVTVSQTIASFAVSPASSSLTAGGTQQFAVNALDQFGNAITGLPVSWSLTGAGSIDNNGLFTHPYNTGSATITATSGTWTATANVAFTGASQWNAAVNSSWNTSGSWEDGVTGAAIAAPGVGVWNNDTVLFAGATGRTVTLDGANPMLAGITFNNSATKYTIAQGSGGALTLQGSSAAISVLAGNDTISAPLVLASNTVIEVDDSSQLHLTGPIIGIGTLTKTGSGILVLNASNAVPGGIIVTDGQVNFTSPDAIASGSSLTVGAGLEFLLGKRS